ncbi:MAG: flippase [Candidatus Komeilibacteria bacterium]|nr:flippase [Candidatus Komeilibacteria bacterium]
MTLTKQIASNTFWQILGKIVGTALGIATIGLLTRYLGSQGFGYYTTALAFMQFFGVLIDMGLYLILLKEISAHPADEEKIFNNIFTLRIISAIILLGGGALLIFIFPYPEAVKWSAVIVSLSFFFASLVQILTAIFQKYLKMGLVALAEVLGRLVFFIAIVLFIFYRGGLTALIWSNVINSLIYFLILWFLIKKFVKISWAFDLAYWKIIWQKSWPLALGIAFNLVYFRADTIILSLYKPAADVGIYGAPYKILEIIATFPHMFMGLVMPVLTAAWVTQNLARFKSVMQKAFDFFIILVVPMVLGSLPLATKIMRLIAGPEFIASGKILPALMLATGIIFIGILFTYALVILDKQKDMLKYYFSAAVLSLIGYFIFIPRYSYYGAAWVTVAIELFIALSAFILTYKFSRLKLSLNIFWKALLASAIMSAMLYWLIAWPTVWLIVLGMAVYGLIMILIKGLNQELIKEITGLK